jgi:hypothetical protein
LAGDTHLGLCIRNSEKSAKGLELPNVYAVLSAKIRELPAVAA